VEWIYIHRPVEYFAVFIIITLIRVGVYRYECVCTYCEAVCFAFQAASCIMHVLQVLVN
jgi:hypothetical protein